MGQTKQLRAIDGFAFGAYEAMPTDEAARRHRGNPGDLRRQFAHP